MPQEVHLSYLPLAHIYESVTINTAIYASAAIGFYQVAACNRVTCRLRYVG